MTSLWRGLGQGTMPKRSRSWLAMKVPIISMAQQARPKVIGQSEDLRLIAMTVSAPDLHDAGEGDAVDGAGLGEFDGAQALGFGAEVGDVGLDLRGCLGSLVIATPILHGARRSRGPRRGRR